MTLPGRKTLIYGGMIAALAGLNLWRWIGADQAEIELSETAQERIATELPQLALARDVAAAPMSGQRDLFRLSPAAAPLPPQPEPSEPTETAAPDPRQIAREQAVAVMEKLRLIGTMSADGRTIALIEHDDRVEQVNVGDEPILGYKVDSITSDVMRISQETLGVTGVFMLTGDEPFRAIWNDK